jgi:hypothetical protein
MGEAKMKNRLHGKKAGIIILCVLIVLSLAETVGNLILDTAFATFSLGEPFATMIFAALILIFTYKKKDRVCYLCYGAWIAWFVMDHIFEFPGMISTLCSTVTNLDALIAMDAAVPTLVSIVLRMATMSCIIAIGALLIEYMNDGTIYNRAFNILSVITVLLLLVSVIVGLVGVASGKENSINIIIYVINNLSRIAMIFLFTFFAYDSAKLQLDKANLTK